MSMYNYILYINYVLYNTVYITQIIPHTSAGVREVHAKQDLLKPQKSQDFEPQNLQHQELCEFLSLGSWGSPWGSLASK